MNESEILHWLMWAPPIGIAALLLFLQMPDAQKLVAHLLIANADAIIERRKIFREKFKQLRGVA